MRRGLCLVGEYDQTGASAAAILAKPPATTNSPNERLFAMLATLGALVAESVAPDAVTPGPVTVKIIDLP
jgi:hypothetical protein